ncbi:hypothetical protein BRAO375_4270017 [Bradyrhizobium sp. ORS 375]|nr:hypothetical protein BRAO375_4270017 [Bradyrhizobium sp. ORS 375]
MICVLSRLTPLLIGYSVMPGLVPGIHVVLSVPADVDGRDKPGHDDVESCSYKKGRRLLGGLFSVH